MYMIRRLVPVMLAFALAISFLPSPISAVSASQYFPQTGQTMNSNFASYFWAHGGIDIFGYPISPEVNQNGKTVQYFERARMEYNPSVPGGVELGHLGKEITDGRSFPQSNQFYSSAEHRYFPETGHSLNNGFKAYWDQRGGLALFGYPISEEFSEVNAVDGETYTVQYFERARFEYHPEFQGTRYEVELGHLGVIVSGRQPNPAPTASAPADTFALNTFEDQMLGKVNAMRASKGLGQVQIDQSLTSIARSRSNDMATRNYFSHDTPEGRSFIDLLKSAGIRYQKTGETLAKNNFGDSGTTQAAFDGLMNSPSHRDILTDGIYDKIGVGHAKSSGGMHYFTLVFLK